MKQIAIVLAAYLFFQGTIGSVIVPPAKGEQNELRDLWPYAKWEETDSLYSGYAVDILKLAAGKMNRNYSFHLFEPLWLANYEVNQHFDSMVNKLESGRADIAIGAIQIMDHSKVDFTVPFMEDIRIAGLILQNNTRDACTIGDLVRTTNLTGIAYGMVRNTFTFRELGKLKGDSVGLRLRLMMEANPTGLYDNYSEGLYQASRFPFTFLLESPLAELVASKHCNYTLLSDGGLLPRMNYGFALPKGSPLLAPLNSAIGELKKANKHKSLMKEYWVDRCKQPLYANCGQSN